MPKLATHTLYRGHISKLRIPMPAEEIVCPRCKCAGGATSLLDPTLKNDERLWFCDTPECIDKDSTQLRYIPKKVQARNIFEKSVYLPYKDD